MAALWIRNLDMEHSYNTHRAAPGLISVRWSINWAQAALYCSYFNRLLSTVLHTYSRNTHEGKISHSLRKPNIEETQQLEKANRHLRTIDQRGTWYSLHLCRRIQFHAGLTEQGGNFSGGYSPSRTRQDHVWADGAPASSGIREST